MQFRARGLTWDYPRPASVMGIVNVTPDSFSDGGRFLVPEAAIEHGLRLAREGAEILDVGGESTRPGAEPVEEKEELRRVMPVIEALADKAGVPVSIDTMKPEVARRAVAAGASIVNDVGANREDPAMWRLVAETGAGYVCMHMQGEPRTMQKHPFYTDVVSEVEAFFRRRMHQLKNCGVAPEQIILDPGIGFGKTVTHNLELLGALERFVRLERPVLLGVSRKSFIGKVGGGEDEAAGRLPGALACAALAVGAGVKLFRAHDPKETVQAIRLAEAVVARKRS